jgi:hypothetical protein
LHQIALTSEVGDARGMKARRVSVGAVLSVLSVGVPAATWATGCDGDVATTTGSGGAGTGGAGAGAGGTGGNHACSADGECSGQAWCDFADDQCGLGVQGSCSDSPGGCSTGTGPYPLVCGCDGAYHGTDCIAFDGTDRSLDVSGCGAPPAGVFQCGTLFCQEDFFYCQLTPQGEGIPDDGACMTLDGSCTTCDCITPLCAGGTCMETNGNLVVTCPLL